MSLKIGIIGLPNVGKSTLFNALTKKKVDISNYPFCTIEPNVGVVTVPDQRLEKLAALSRSKKIVPAVVEFVDIAGLVKGAAEGEGLGNKFLSHIKEVDALAEVVRIFEDKNISHVSGAPNAVSDIEILEYELALKDLETVMKRADALEKEARGLKKGAAEELEELKKIKKALESDVRPEISEFKIVRDLQLLTAKPVIYVLNASEAQIQEKRIPDERIAAKIKNAPWVAICAKMESELSGLTDEEQKEYLKSVGVKEGGLEKLIKTGYETLGLITFFTTGEDESRAWTIPRGSLAPRAGRAIHSDFEKKFIRVEVINWEKLTEAGSWIRAKELGLIRTEGKEYAVRDGDVVEFKI